ncbi:MAG: hypothetical protein IKE37_00485 [Firmicutes bacterium]|nr:hypothetical protein [Bacillota bacterium]
MKKYPDIHKEESRARARTERVYAGPEREPEPAEIEDVYNGPDPGLDAISGVYAGPDMNLVYGGPGMMGGTAGTPIPEEPEDTPVECVYAGPEMMGGSPDGIRGIGLGKAEKEPEKKHSGIRGIFRKK